VRQRAGGPVSTGSAKIDDIDIIKHGRRFDARVSLMQNGRLSTSSKSI
jgi:hypothetical protein